MLSEPRLACTSASPSMDGWIIRDEGCRDQESVTSRLRRKRLGHMLVFVFWLYHHLMEVEI